MAQWHTRPVGLLPAGGVGDQLLLTGQQGGHPVHKSGEGVVVRPAEDPLRHKRIILRIPQRSRTRA